MRHIRLIVILVAAAMIVLSVLIDLLPGGTPGFGVKQLFLALGGVTLLMWSLFLARASWQRQVLTVMFLTMLVVGAEFFLRWLTAPYFTANLQLDDVCLVRPVAGVRKISHPLGQHRYHMPVGSKPVSVEINEDGFRGPPLREHGAALRVAVYGDSYIMADFTPDEKIFVRRLEAELEERLGTPVETVNAGVKGYGPGQICARLPNDLEQLRPDLLLVAIFAGDDFGDLVRHKLYRLADDGSLAKNEFQIGEDMQREFAFEQSDFALYKLLSYALGRLNPSEGDIPRREDSLEKRKDRFSAWLQDLEAEYKEFVVHQDNTVTRWGVGLYDADVAALPNSDSARYKKKLMRAVLARIQQTVNEADVPLLIVVIPSVVDVCDRTEGIAIDTEVYPEYRREALTDAVADTAQQLGITHFSLFETLYGPDAEGYYYEFDDHWNVAGHQFCAAAVADFIASRKLLRGE